MRVLSYTRARIYYVVLAERVILFTTVRERLRVSYLIRPYFGRTVFRASSENISRPHAEPTACRVRSVMSSSSSYNMYRICNAHRRIRVFRIY